MIGLEGDWALIVTVVAGLSFVGAIGLTVVIGRHYHRAWRGLTAAGNLDGAEEALRERYAGLQTAERRLAELHDEIAWHEKARAETSVWQLRLAEIRQRVGAANHDTDELEVIKDDIARCREEQLQAQQELVLQRAANEDLDRQARALAGEASMAQARLNQDRQTLAQLAREIAVVQHRHGEALSARQSVERGEEPAAEAAAALRRELDDVRAELARGQAELADIHQAIETARVAAVAGDERERSRLRQLRQDIAAAEMQHAEAIEDVREVQQSREALTREIVEIELNLETGRDELDQCGEHLAAVRRTLETSRAEAVEDLRQLQQRREALTEEISEIERSLERRQAELARCHDELALVRRELELGRTALAAPPPEPVLALPPVVPLVQTAKAPVSPAQPPEALRRPAPAGAGGTVRKPAGRKVEPSALEVLRGTLRAVDKQVSDLAGRVIDAGMPRQPTPARREADARPNPAPRQPIQPSSNAKAAESPPRRPNPATPAAPTARKGQAGAGAGAGLEILRGTFQAVDSALSTYLFPKAAPKKRPGPPGKQK